jgi:hypothetical protein
MRKWIVCNPGLFGEGGFNNGFDFVLGGHGGGFEGRVISRFFSRGAGKWR